MATNIEDYPGRNKRNNYYSNADEKFVKKVILYGYQEMLFYDPECTRPVVLSEVLDLYMDGVVICVGAVIFTPVSYHTDEQAIYVHSRDGETLVFRGVDLTI